MSSSVARALDDLDAALALLTAGHPDDAAPELVAAVRLLWRVRGVLRSNLHDASGIKTAKSFSEQSKNSH